MRKPSASEGSTIVASVPQPVTGNHCSFAAKKYWNKLANTNAGTDTPRMEMKITR